MLPDGMRLVRKCAYPGRKDAGYDKAVGFS